MVLTGVRDILRSTAAFARWNSAMAAHPCKLDVIEIRVNTITWTNVTLYIATMTVTAKEGEADLITKLRHRGLHHRLVSRYIVFLRCLPPPKRIYISIHDRYISPKYAWPYDDQWHMRKSEARLRFEPERSGKFAFTEARIYTITDPNVAGQGRSLFL